MRDTYAAALAVALEEARRGVAEGGMPFGAALADREGNVLASGRNRQLQDGDWFSHAETVCLGSFASSFDKVAELPDTVLVATEAPCPMCAGAAIIAGIGTVVVGESVHFQGGTDLLEARGVQVIDLADPQCIDLVTTFKERHPGRWDQFSA